MNAASTPTIPPSSDAIRIPMGAIVQGLSRHIDMVHPDLKGHHHLTARLAVAIGRSAGVCDAELRRLSLAALLHDAGALSLKERLNLLEFEADFGSRRPMPHAEAAYILLVDFAPLKTIAEIVRHHHVHWASRRQWEDAHGPIPPACHLLHLADRVAVLMDGSAPILNQTERIRGLIRLGAGDMFSPKFVEAFEDAAQRESFWLEMADPEGDGSPSGPLSATWIDMDRAGLDDLAKLFCRFIDFKSHYTALHSSGVSGTAEGLALKAGLPPERAFLLRIAGYLHDAGKVAIPTELLEKPGALTREEFNIVKGHAYFTGKILRGLQDLGPVREWATLHHERPDGRGYPYRRGGADLPLEARIVAAADIYMALREDRPHRPAFDPAGAFKLMHAMARDGAVDPDLTALLEREREFVDGCQSAALSEAGALHLRFHQSLSPGRRAPAPRPQRASAP